jgi:hypothetical protein
MKEEVHAGQLASGVALPQEEDLDVLVIHQRNCSVYPFLAMPDVLLKDLKPNPGNSALQIPMNNGEITLPQGVQQIEHWPAFVFYPG